MSDIQEIPGGFDVPAAGTAGAVVFVHAVVEAVAAVRASVESPAGKRSGSHAGCGSPRGKRRRKTLWL